MSESQWIPSSRAEMAWIGPIVNNDIFFYAVILGVAALLVLREWGKPAAAAAAPPANDAARRRIEYERRSQRRWMFAAAFTFVAVILLLAADFVYADIQRDRRVGKEQSAAKGMAQVPVEGAHAGEMAIRRPRRGHKVDVPCG